MPSYRIGNSQTHLRVSWLSPPLCPLKLARLWLFSHNVKDRARRVVNRAVSALRRSQARWLVLALSHDGLRIFANRILANRIFADRVLADWRRRHRGRLPARQIGGSGNAQHGDEPSRYGRYDYDDLHNANPLVLGTRTGRPSDTPIPLVCARRPLLPFHVPAPSPGGMAPNYLSLWGWIGSNAIGRIGKDAD